MNQSDYALQAVKGIKMSFDNAVKNRLDQYKEQSVIKFYSTAEVSEIYTSTEGLEGSRELSNEETPPSLKLEDGYSVTLTEKRFGGAVVLPENVYRRDGVDRTLMVDQFLMRQRNQLMIDQTNLLLTRAFAMLNESFSSSSDYLAPDGVEVCGAHLWKSGGTFTNAVTAALSTAAIDAAWDYAGAFTDPANKAMPLNWNTIVVKKGSAAEREAIRLFAKQVTPTKIGDINIYEGMMKIIATPYITYANKTKWWLIDTTTYESPLAVGVGEYPTLREPIKESNEAIRTNCTGFWKQGVINMPFTFYGSTGTT